jgi:sec-independent protein translocase protein TatC
MVLRRLYVPEERMTFGGHLEELRRRIIYAVLALAVTTVFCFAFLQDPLVNLILQPHFRASADRARAVGYRQLERANAVLAGIAEELPGLSSGACLAFLPEVEREKQLTDHLRQPVEELLRVARRGLPDAEVAGQVDALATAFSRAVSGAVRTELAKVESGAGVSVRLAAVAEKFQDLMVAQGGRLRGFLSTSPAEITQKLLPDVCAKTAEARRRAQPGSEESSREGALLARRLSVSLDSVEKGIESLKSEKGAKIVALTYTESFITYLKVVLIFAIFFSFPVILWQAWKFIGAGLHTHEQRVALVFLPASLGLFLVGVIFGYELLIPWGLSYLSSYGDPELLDTVLSISAYLSFFMTLTVLLGIIFQVPLVMFLLVRVGLVDANLFTRYRRHAILIAVVAASILTPPDPFTQIMLGIPLIALFEIGVQVSKIAQRKAQASQSPDRDATPKAPQPERAPKDRAGAGGEIAAIAAGDAHPPDERAGAPGAGSA